MSKNTVEEKKHWRIQWGLVLWPKGPWDINVTFLLYHVCPLKPDVSIHKASLKPCLNLVKFLGKDNYAENYQTLDSPGVRPCKLEPENIRLKLWCQSHPQHKDYRCNQRRNSSQNLSDLKSSRTLETAAKYPRPETSHPGTGSHVIWCSKACFYSKFMERGKITDIHCISWNVFLGFFSGMVFLLK